VDAVVLVSVGQLPQLRGAPGEAVGEGVGNRLGGGLLLQGLGVLKELGGMVIGARDVRARRSAAVQARGVVGVQAVTQGPSRL